MPDDDEQLPVFVYGTLLRGEVNADQLEGRVARVERGLLPGHRLYELEYPCVVGVAPDEHETDGPVVHGELVWLEGSGYRVHLAHLDRFEAYDAARPEGSLYLRTRAQVVSSAGVVVRCWVYVAGPSMAHRLTADHEVASGDWRAPAG